MLWNRQYKQQIIELTLLKESLEQKLTKQGVDKLIEQVNTLQKEKNSLNDKLTYSKRKVTQLTDEIKALEKAQRELKLSLELESSKSVNRKPDDTTAISSRTSFNMQMKRPLPHSISNKSSLKKNDKVNYLNQLYGDHFDSKVLRLFETDEIEDFYESSFKHFKEKNMGIEDVSKRITDFKNKKAKDKQSIIFSEQDIIDLFMQKKKSICIGKSWNPDSEALLADLYSKDASVELLAKLFEITIPMIRSRLVSLEKYIPTSRKVDERNEFKALYEDICFVLDLEQSDFFTIRRNATKEMLEIIVVAISA